MRAYARAAGSSTLPYPPYPRARARPWHARTHTLQTRRAHTRARATHTSCTCSHTSLLAEWGKRHTSPFATPFLALLPCRFSDLALRLRLSAAPSVFWGSLVPRHRPAGYGTSLTAVAVSSVWGTSVASAAVWFWTFTTGGAKTVGDESCPASAASISASSSAIS